MSSPPTPSYSEYFLVEAEVEDHVATVAAIRTSDGEVYDTATVDLRMGVEVLWFGRNSLRVEGRQMRWTVCDPSDQRIPESGVPLEAWMKDNSWAGGKWYDRSSLALSFRI